MATVYCLNRKVISMYLNMISKGLYMCIRDDHREIVIELYADEDVATYQKRLASYLKKMWQRVRNVLQVTWRRRYSVSGTCCKLLEEDVTTYQEHLASYLKKSLQRIRKSCKLFTEDVTTLWGRFGKLVECNVTTYQERLDSDLKKMYEHVTTHQVPPCWSPKPTPCPSPASQSQTLKVCISCSPM